MEKVKGLFTKIKNALGKPFRKESELPTAPPVDDATVVFSGQEELASASKNVPPRLEGDALTGKGRSRTSLFKPRDSRPLFAIGVILSTVKIAFIALAALIAVAVGLVFGVANAYLGATPELNLEQINEHDLTSYIYDSNDTLLTVYTGTENRDYAAIDEIPVQLQNAVIAVEDVRFRSHSGVDYKGLISAFFNNMSSSGSVSGGSTITQQLIKNQLLSSERSYKRKIQEASLALQLEEKYSKDQILEAYLNTINLGAGNYGVKTAAQDYFGKELDELSLREIACIAGITQRPWAYNPRRVYYQASNRENAIKALDSRIEHVLAKMYENGFISKEEYDAAKNDRLVVKEKSDTQDMYAMPHFVEYAMYDVVTHFLKEEGLEDTEVNRKAMQNKIRTGGYHIYTTVDPSIQNTVQATISEWDKYPRFKNSADATREVTNSDGTVTEIIQPQASSVVLEQDTGYIRALVGSRDVPTVRQTLNRAYEARMPVGSSIKPLAVYGPAFDKGSGLGTIIANVPADLPGWGAFGYPKTSQGKYGPTTIRKGIVSSLNIVAARTLEEKVGVADSYNYLLNLGISPEKLQKDGVGLSLGSSGISSLEMAGGYACIANGGVYREPISFTKVLDSDKRVVMTAADVQDVHRVFAESTAFMLVDALTNAVKSGTGTRAKIKGITVAGKTGTVLENRGAFFAGITGYYVSTLWVGHDNFKPFKSGGGGQVCAPIWQAYMSKILEGKEDKAILSGSAADYSVVKGTVCSVSGMKPLGICPKTTDYFASGTVPTESCDMHISMTVCSESGKLPTEYCPETSSGTAVVLPSDSPYNNMHKIKASSLFTVATNTEEVCDIHTEEWAAAQADLSAAKKSAEGSITAARSFLNTHAAVLSAQQVNTVRGLIDAVSKAISAEAPSATAIRDAAGALDSAVSSIKASLPTLPPEPPNPTPAPADPSPSLPAPTPTPSDSDAGDGDT